MENLMSIGEFASVSRLSQKALRLYGERGLLPPAWVDPGLLERAVANLLDNAQRWSPNTPVTVRAEASDDTLRLDVVDHGPGVEESKWEAMFTPFQRLDDTSSGGVGLGLAIVRGLLDPMGASVTPHHTPGGGLTMTITVPRAR